MNSSDEEDLENDPDLLLDIGELVRGYRIRTDVERAFFFHLTYKILRDKLGMKIAPTDKDFFKNKSKIVDTNLDKNLDLKALLHGLEAYEVSTQAEKDLMLKERGRQIIYHRGGPNNP